MMIHWNWICLEVESRMTGDRTNLVRIRIWRIYGFSGWIPVSPQISSLRLSARMSKGAKSEVGIDVCVVSFLSKRINARKDAKSRLLRGRSYSSLQPFAPFATLREYLWDCFARGSQWRVAFDRRSNLVRIRIWRILGFSGWIPVSPQIPSSLRLSARISKMSKGAKSEVGIDVCVVSFLRKRINARKDAKSRLLRSRNYSSLQPFAPFATLRESLLDCFATGSQWRVAKTFVPPSRSSDFRLSTFRLATQDSSVSPPYFINVILWTVRWPADRSSTR